MNSRRLVLLLTLPILLGAAFLLITGSPLLVQPLPGIPAFPAGTLITWLGIVALPLSIYMGIPSFHAPTSRTMRIYQSVLIGILGVAVSWGLISYLLANNWSFSFSSGAPGFRSSPRASWYFWFYSYLAGGLPIIFLLVFGLHRLVLLIIQSLRKKK